MTHKTPAVLLIALLAGSATGFAQIKPLELKWNELAPIVTGHHVTLTLADGASVKGEAVAIRDNSMLLDVSAAVPGYPKGSGSVPGSSIVLIDLQRTRGSWGRTLGTVIGVLGGISLGAYVVARSFWNISAGEATGTFVGAAGGGAVIGYLAGRAIDKRITHIRLIP